MKFSKFNIIVNNEENCFLFNTLSGNCIEIDKNFANIIKEDRIDLIDDATLNTFIKTGVIISDSVDENRIVKYYHDREKFASDTIVSTVLLSWGCNLKCVYCFEGDKHKNINMNIENADKYLKFLKNLALEKKAQNVSICLFGGEPLVNFKTGKYILENMKEFCDEQNMNLSCSIITNGTLLTEDIIETLISFNCNMIQITLDGLKEIHDSRRMYKDDKGSFERIIQSLKLLKDKKDKIHSVIRINIDKTNIEETKNLLSYIGRNGIDLTNSTVDFGIVRGSTEACAAYSGQCFAEGEIGDILFMLWNIAEEEGFKYNIRPMRRWLYCGLYSDSQYTVTPDCEVYKCWEHAGEKEHLMGRIDENGNLFDLQYALYDWMSRDPLMNADCKECVYLPNCGGGCGVVSYNKAKTYHSAGCFKIKGVIEKQVLKYVEMVLQKQL